MTKKEYTIEDANREIWRLRKLKWLLYLVIAVGFGLYFLGTKWMEQRAAAKQKAEQLQHHFHVLENPGTRDFYCFYGNNQKFLARLDSVQGETYHFSRSLAERPHFSLTPEPMEISTEFDASGAKFAPFTVEKSKLKNSLNNSQATFSIPEMGENLYVYWDERIDGAQILTGGYSHGSGKVFSCNFENRGLPCELLKIEPLVGQVSLASGQLPVHWNTRERLMFKPESPTNDLKFRLITASDFNKNVAHEVEWEGDGFLINRLE